MVFPHFFNIIEIYIQLWRFSTKKPQRARLTFGFYSTKQVNIFLCKTSNALKFRRISGKKGEVDNKNVENSEKG